jgi:PTH1 family peptidyl-tRNA hydrolase
MNLSGMAVRSFAHFYKIPLENTLVVFDDLDLPFGSLRIRKSGGSSGQKGMKSIIENLGSEDFPRIRVGIGRPHGKMNSADFILDKFNKAQEQDLNLILDKCSDAIEYYLKEGIDSAMNRYNGSLFNND